LGVDAQRKDDFDNGGALGRGPSRHAVEARLVLSLELAGAFRRVRRDRQRCPAELIFHVSTATRQPLDDLSSETNEIDGDLIGVQFLVVEVRHPHSYPSTQPSAQLRTIDSIAGTGTGTGTGTEGQPSAIDHTLLERSTWIAPASMP